MIHNNGVSCRSLNLHLCSSGPAGVSGGHSTRRRKPEGKGRTRRRSETGELSGRAKTAEKPYREVSAGGVVNPRGTAEVPGSPGARTEEQSCGHQEILLEPPYNERYVHWCERAGASRPSYSISESNVLRSQLRAAPYTDPDGRNRPSGPR